MLLVYFFFSSRRRHTRLQGDWSSDVCSSDLSPIGRRGDLWGAHGVLVGSRCEYVTEWWAAVRIEVLGGRHHVGVGSTAARTGAHRGCATRPCARHRGLRLPALLAQDERRQRPVAGADPAVARQGGIRDRVLRSTIP